MEYPLRVLIVEDCPTDAGLILYELRRAGYEPCWRRVETEADYLSGLDTAPELILADYHLPQFDALRALALLRERGLDIPLIIVSSTTSEEVANVVMQHGAADYLLKDRLARLGQAVRHALEQKRLRDEKRRMAEELRQQFERLAALRAIDQAILSSFDLRTTLNILLDQVTILLGIHAAAILLFDPDTELLECAAERGFHTQNIVRSQRKLGECGAGRALLERSYVSITDLPSHCEECRCQRFLASEGFVEYHAVPLVTKGQIKGVLELYHRQPLTTDTDWIDFLGALVGQAALAIDHASLIDELQRSNAQLTLAYDATLEGWSRALDLRDRETEGHSQRVTEMTLRLARTIGMGAEELVHVRRGALLHDIGKLGIPDSILHKPGPLTEEEWAIMRKHPVYAYEMLTPIEFLGPALDIPYCHHEKWDGTGYPRGLKGEEIPLPARLFALADVWDALRSDRPYRQGWPEGKIREHIRSLAGTHFDPKVVEVFLGLEL